MCWASRITFTTILVFAPFAFCSGSVFETFYSWVGVESEAQNNIGYAGSSDGDPDFCEYYDLYADGLPRVDPDAPMGFARGADCPSCHRCRQEVGKQSD